MKHNAKGLYEKMLDFKRFAISLLAVGSFFYLGMILPTEQAVADSHIMTVTSVVFLAGAIFFFMVSRKYRSLLAETEGGDEYLMKK